TPENCGLRKIGLRRSAADPAVLEIFVSVRNYSAQARAGNLALLFGGAPVGTKSLSLGPGTQQGTSFEHRTHASGPLEVRLLTRDAFPADDRAVLELPEQKTLAVTVYSNEPEMLRPILEANPHVRAVFHSVSEYSPTRGAGLVILDRFR